MPEDSLTIHEMGASDAGAAFVAGKLDAAVSWEPWLSKASEREGGHLLADTIHIMSRRPGRIIKSIAVDIPRPRDHRTSLRPEFTAIEKDSMETLWEELS